MAQICSKCSRTNPEDACYCYFDGFVLGHGAGRGPVAVGAQVFAHPFVFPTGRACRNFDELALACQDDWRTAREMLGQGHLESFFGGLGRSDLAAAAREAGKFPDHDRGLDDLLAKLPSDVLAAPRLGLDTDVINLGVVKVGDSLEFTLHLENKGMRLLYGTISCSRPKDVWLTLGDTPGTSEKHFQFGGEQTIKVKVVGDRLRANVKPLEAKLVIDSNGGQETVVVRAEVPVKTFPAGVLGGSRSPRDLATKAKKYIKEAAPCFERGEIETWYRDNGWNYPVQGPAFSGIHAIQQFFEALGLVQPPPVEIDTRAIAWSANPGERLTYEIKVESPEKKPVFAYATSDQPWIKPEKTKLTGRTASISIVVPAVPAKPGRTLSARLTVHSNGNKSFAVPVSLAVSGNPVDGNGDGESEPDIARLEPVAAAVPAFAELTAAGPSRSAALAPPPLPAARAPVRAAPVPAVLAPPAPQTLESLTDPGPAPGRRTGRSRRRAPGVPLWMHLLPALALGCAVLGVVIYDLADSTRPDGPSGSKHSGDQQLIVEFHRERHGSFGIQSESEKDPTDPSRNKRLTFDTRGAGDNIVVRIEGTDYFFHLSTPDHPNRVEHLKKPRIRQINTKVFKEFDLQIEQHVELVAGTSGARDTVLVYYILKKNKTAKSSQKVGLRVLIDTYIGANDGVPFTIPGHPGFLRDKREFSEKEIPDYIEAIESPDTPSDLGTIVRMGLKHLKVGTLPEFDPIHKMRICLYPGSQIQWDWDMESIMKGGEGKGDSCVALYWAETTMNPDDERVMGYTYGLSELSTSGGDSPIALSAPPTVQPGAEFVVTVYVWNGRPGQKIKLELPEGLTLAANESEDKLIDDAKRAQVSWRVKAGNDGEFKVTAKAGATISKPIIIKVRRGSLFG